MNIEYTDIKEANKQIKILIKEKNQSLEAQMLTMQLSEDILQELKSERSSKEYIVNHILPELKKEIKNLENQLKDFK